jgi:hypothetical protein
MRTDTIHAWTAGNADALWTWDEAAAHAEDEVEDERDGTMFAPESLFSLPIDDDVELIPSPPAKAESQQGKVQSGEWSLEVYPIASIARGVLQQNGWPVYAVEEEVQRVQSLFHALSQCVVDGVVTLVLDPVPLHKHLSCLLGVRSLVVVDHTGLVRALNKMIQSDTYRLGQDIWSSKALNLASIDSKFEFWYVWLVLSRLGFEPNALSSSLATTKIPEGLIGSTMFKNITVWNFKMMSMKEHEHPMYYRRYIEGDDVHVLEDIRWKCQKCFCTMTQVWFHQQNCGSSRKRKGKKNAAMGGAQVKGGTADVELTAMGMKFVPFEFSGPRENLLESMSVTHTTMTRNPMCLDADVSDLFFDEVPAEGCDLWFLCATMYAAGVDPMCM